MLSNVIAGATNSKGIVNEIAKYLRNTFVLFLFVDEVGECIVIAR